MTKNPKTKVPIWVSIFQGILIAIMLQQAYMFYFDHQSVAASGITVDGSTPNLNFIYEFAGRTATMAIISIIVLITQNPRYFLVVLGMNLFREGQETIIDPLFPLLNAPASPLGDLIAHLVIIAIELWAFIAVLKIVRQMDKDSVN